MTLKIFGMCLCLLSLNMYTASGSLRKDRLPRNNSWPQIQTNELSDKRTSAIEYQSQKLHEEEIPQQIFGQYLSTDNSDLDVAPEPIDTDHSRVVPTKGKFPFPNCDYRSHTPSLRKRSDSSSSSISDSEDSTSSSEENENPSRSCSCRGSTSL